MKKLRLVVFKECDRKCPGCCNNYWDIDNLPVVDSFKEYDEVILTGGEPMLDPKLIISLINLIKKENKLANIYMYTAKTDSPYHLNLLVRLLDGVTITLHEQADVDNFIEFDRVAFGINKSLRLNVFKGIEVPYNELINNWIIAKDRVWDSTCGLPQYEVLMRLF